jgi:hypothetical protein
MFVTEIVHILVYQIEPETASIQILMWVTTQEQVLVNLTVPE